MKQNLTNYHSHCDFCDGNASMERFLQEAVGCGMTAYGVTSHTTFPVEGRSLQPDTYSPYFAEAARLKVAYHRQIEFYVGLEIDYLDAQTNPSSAFYRAMPTDYTVGSIHFIPAACGGWMGVDGAFDGFRQRLSRCFADDIREVVVRFYEQSRKLAACGGFTIYGHPDKIALNASLFCPGITEELWYEELVVAHLRRLAEVGCLVEVNTKAWEQHHRLFPAVELLPLVRKLGLPLVVNSDCHYPERVNSGRLEALRILRDAGIDTVWELHGGRWGEVPICV